MIYALMPIPLPLAETADRTHVTCTECAKCCTYVAVGINAPSRWRAASEVLWFLYHDKVEIYRDATGEWSVVFETRCRNLAPDLRCGVYEHRPQICREFDDEGCEVNAPEGSLTLRTPAEFLDWLRAHHPGVHRRLQKGLVPPALRR